MKTSFIRYETLIGVGLLLLIGGALNGLSITTIDSDLFWAVTGIGLITEGLLERKDFN
jgi:hypothetical protein|tara:strand:- start:1667 stop:1840 length:174 start_codon:yes stop_codon:yes gene_type:complete